MENKTQPLANKATYYKRLYRRFSQAIIILTISLIIGTLGYKLLGHLTWIDSFYNASMILGGMGPVSELTNNAAKIFASLYAIISGAILLGVFGLVFTPVMHRVLHQLHIEN
ncbi:MAG: hypothetical protein ABI844_17935 [Saprospiraceae bacterium]